MKISLYARGEVIVWKGQGLKLALMLLKQLMEKKNGGDGDISVTDFSEVPFYAVNVLGSSAVKRYKMAP